MERKFNKDFRTKRIGSVATIDGLDPSNEVIINLIEDQINGIITKTNGKIELIKIYSSIEFFERNQYGLKIVAYVKMTLWQLFINLITGVKYK